MKKIQISAGSVAQALDRFERVWQQAEKGTVPAAQLRLIELGLIERQADRKAAVLWDVVSAEMRRAA